MGMLPLDGDFAVMLQETGIAIRAQEMNAATAPRDKVYIPFLSERVVKTGSPSRGLGLLTAVSFKYMPENKVLSYTEIVQGEPRPCASACTGRGLTLINVYRPQARRSPSAGQVSLLTDVQMYATACRLCGQQALIIAGNTNLYVDATPSYGKCPLRLRGLRHPDGHSSLDGEHEGHTSPVAALGGRVPGQRAPRVMVPAGRCLDPGHGALRCSVWTTSQSA